MMICTICGKDSIKEIYKGPLRTGLRDGYTREDIPVFQCPYCKTIWHKNPGIDETHYYESDEYWTQVSATSMPAYYDARDKDALIHFNNIQLELLRNAAVADVGCAGGSFLDFVSGIAKNVIGIEPSNEYRRILSGKYDLYPYVENALDKWRGKLDVVTSFDVIEHVPDPTKFMLEAHGLLRDGGTLIIGTPTDYPVLRQILGDEFNRFIFSIHHPWVFSQDSLRILAEKCGFKDIRIRGILKYGLGNLLAWLYYRKPKGNVNFDFISDTLNAAYKEEMARNGYYDYLFVYATK